ncbi:hypothetical protein PHMEG_00011645 [Phytophthora megakarya]|uniref:Ty3 transposon capsid-like protein domain-containing protein n=1 Tax=Phytophthora megakarya TaxID=4795 RepID=A0A225WAP4_9STRA|nr:hypothetical protein PHMEG_00011645 [Phytophthora megakarya]
MPTNAEVHAEIEWLNQAMAARARVPSNLPKFTGMRGENVRDWLFQIGNTCCINGIPIEDSSTRLLGIAGSVMEKLASGWFLHWSSTMRSEKHTWGIFREHVLQHFEASNYQAVLREMLQRLNQEEDIESYNGKYSALIFRVEGMSVLDQVLHEWTQASHTQLREGRDEHKSFKGKPFHEIGTFKAKSEDKPWSWESQRFAWKKEQVEQENDKPLRIHFSVSGEISVSIDCFTTRSMLLDCRVINVQML